MELMSRYEDSALGYEYPNYPDEMDKANYSNMCSSIKSFVAATSLLLLPSDSEEPQYSNIPSQTNPTFMRRISNDASAEIPESSLVLRTVSEQAKLIVTNLGLNKSQLATVFGVSRPTIYAWLKGDTEDVNEDNESKLKALSELVSSIALESDRPLFHGYVKRSMPNHEFSILELLSKDKWDSGRLNSLMMEARNLTAARDEKLAKVKTRNVKTVDEKENILSDNLSYLELEG